MTTAIFAITDGTDYVNMIGPNSGYFIKEWRPQTADLKGGGSWRSSPLVDGRKIATAKLDNVIESPVIGINAYSPDAIARDTQKLRRLFKKARDYWYTDAQSEPVWMEARAEEETNTRYALIANARATEDGDPFNSPFTTTDEIIVMDDFILNIEREPLWRYEIPGNTTAIALSAVETFNGVDFGNVDDAEAREPTTNNEVYFAGKRNTANLSHVYVDDGGVFGSNLIGAALPFSILPATPAVNDAVYFGSRTSITDSGPFHSLVFDLSQTIDDTIVWEYWNGSWTAFNATTEIEDQTIGFSAGGVVSVHWFPQSDWATTAVNGITGYWVRARVTALGILSIPPIQQNRNIYSIVWPYVELQSTMIKGDWPALGRLKIYNHSCGDRANRQPQLYTDKLIIGVRRVERGSNFTAYINCSDEQNPSGITVSATGTATFGTDVENAPSGRYVDWTPGAASNMAPRCNIELDNTIASHFYGKFHAWVRVRQPVGGAEAFRMRLRVLANDSTSNLYKQSRIVTVDATVASLVPLPVDFGEFSIPPGGVKNSETLNKLYFSIRAECLNAGGGQLKIIDLIVIPADEWIGDIGEIASLTNTHILGWDNYLDADSCTFPKKIIYTPVRVELSGNIEVTYRAISASPIIIPTEKQVRIWFFPLQTRTVTDNHKASEPWQGLSAQLEVVQRYESMIGGDI